MLPYLEQIINQVSQELNVPFDVCCKAYMSQWQFILDKVKQYDYKDLTPEEFKKIRPNFNIPSLGKLCVTQERFENCIKAIEYKRNILKQKEAEKDVQD